MGVDNFLSADAAGKRQAKRARVLLSAKLKTAWGEVDCRLRDLSRKGALVECATPLPEGSEVVFIRSSTIVPARVAWSAGQKVGLEFHFMIDEHEVLVQLKKPSSTQQEQQRFRRPGLNEDLTDRDRRVARAWGKSVGIALPEGEI
jgi:hypothetical protein